MSFLDWFSSLTQLQTVRSRILNDPYYRFQSAEEIQLAASLGIKIDANRAAVDDWLRLPGLSIHQARTLANLSQSGVHFHCLEDIAAALGLPVQRLKPLEPVLLFCYYDPDSVQTIQTVNVNTASVEQLVRIPGMDLYLARAIAENRAAGPYHNLAHLQHRLALSVEQTEQLMHYFRF
jgi:DNA uptake protein ComE-like DNA-binding protein